MPNHHSFPDLNCIVYLDSFKKVEEGVVDAYLDFRLKRDFDMFRNVLNYPETTATYIELRFMKSKKRLFQGCYYKLNLNLLKQYRFSQAQESSLIGGSFELSEMAKPDGDDDEVLQSHETLDPEEMSMQNVPRNASFNVESLPDWELYVKDVGQANWNELRNGNRVEVLYDAGAELHATAYAVQKVFDSRRKALEQSKPILVLSHWDIDHIHCLKPLTVKDISACFSKLICVDKIKSVTSRNILTNFINALGKENVFCLPIPARRNGIEMHPWKRCDNITFFQGEQSRNINYCGLVLFVKGKNISVNLTGDCRLSQANNAYQQELGLGINTKQHILVAPHHGGDCGATFRSYMTRCDSILISVGAGNYYGHPQKDMLEYLDSLGPVERTDLSGDIVKKI